MADTSGTTVLLTAFEPFGGAATNPSWDAVSALAERWDGPARLVTEQLPVVFAEVRQRLAAAILEHRPAVVIETGLAEGRTAVTPERVAINVQDARIPDNAGARPVDEPIDPNGRPAYFTSLPIKRIVAEVRVFGVPAAVSNTAGTFTCNQAFYELMSLADREGLRAGFVHVPATTGFGDHAVPTLPLEDVVRALEVVVREALRGGPDLVEQGGAEH